MNDDDPTPEEVAAAEAAQAQASAQSTAPELARMGIDPRSLGLELDQRQGSISSSADPAERSPADPPARRSTDQANVVPLRPDVPRPDLPEPGTSSAWSPFPPALTYDGGSRAEATVGPLELLLGQQVSLERAKMPVSQLARAVTIGMLTPDSADAADREREMVNRVRTRQTDQRVVVFLSGKGGVGTTSVAVGVGCVLAALRDDSTTLVSLRPGTVSLGLALAAERAPTARDISRAGSDVSPLVLTNGLQVVDGPRWGTPVRRSDIPQVLDRLGQLATFALFDVGNDPSESSHSVLSRADQVVIVSGAGVDGVDAARVAAERAAEVDPYLLDSAIYVVVCQREGALKSVVKAMRQTMPSGGRVVAVPPEVALADGLAFDPAQVTLATRLAMIDVAGLVALGSVAQTSGRWR